MTTTTTTEEHHMTTTYDELLEQLYDLDPAELRQLAHEAVLIADNLDAVAASPEGTAR